MIIDRHAPLTARKEIVVAAPVDVVWNIHTDIERWPEWQPDISSISLEGTLAPGTLFRWKAQGLKITSTLQEVEPQRGIGWTGVALGMKAIHIWKFESQDNSTRVVTEESLSGWLARLLKLFDPAFLDKSLEASLRLLKAKAEQA
ncbi:hypothetical protein EVC37_19090 [Methylocaldum sp. BRCS4]|jgi:uncharacterized membrane protein|uniref:SRPBCC family protein n=1 Tax=Methylocaldum sp. 14B TaxID=1912213 RepID=UPI00098A49C2|nr:SRPBCC family protein [Methylocaldum sp. 14B]MVF23699.1 hypothetical protein [Methylocaldum sp. BRCS4]